MKYGLLGEKLGHSFSPLIHNMLGNPDYGLIPLPKEALSDFFRRREFSGLNVTIPYKREVIPFLSRISQRAGMIGSVNTVVKLSDGSLYGDNTDYMGLACMAHEAGISFSGKKVLILGSGGTSLTAQAVAEDGGAAEIIVVSRKGEHNYNNLSAHYDSQVIINTTPVGMYPGNGESLIRLSDFPACEGVIDVIYNPLRTPLLLEAEELGIPCTNGLFMLVAQAKFASDLFFAGDETLLSCKADDFSPERIPEDDLEQIRGIYRKLTGDLTDLVLIGMPSSGKSTVGRILAEELGRPFVDLDAALEEEYGQSIPEIFSREGEEGFRKKESLICQKIGSRQGIVIACGGGVVLRRENYGALRQNGRIFFLERELQSLETEGRPLSRDHETLCRMYRERLPLYQAWAEAQVENNGPAEACAEAIQRLFEHQGKGEEKP